MPGNYIKFNYIFSEYDISLGNQFIKNFALLLNLYKKNKDIIFINIIFFIVSFFLKDLKRKEILDNDKIYEIQDFIFKNLNNYLLYNINQNTLINAVNDKIENG